MRLQHGMIGKVELDRAKEEFLSWNYDEDQSFFIERLNNYVRGKAFKDIEELLSGDEGTLYSFKTIDEYKEYLNEEADEHFDFDFVDDEIKDLLLNGDEAHIVYRCGNEYVNGDKETSIIEAVGDGDNFCFNVELAKNMFKKDSFELTSYEESFIVWLLR